MRLLHRIETAATLASLALAPQPGSTQNPARVPAHDSLRGRSDFPIAGFARQIELVTRLVRELASDSL